MKKKRFTDNGNGTITDNRTGLVWVKDGNSAGCNNGNALTWKQGISFCKNLDYAGYKDWRLPSIQELQSIVDYGRCDPTINSFYFPHTHSYYWSSTTHSHYTDVAWNAYFYNGNVNDYDKTDYNHVRPVRGRGKIILFFE